MILSLNDGLTSERLTPSRLPYMGSRPGAAYALCQIRCNPSLGPNLCDTLSTNA